MIGVSGITPAVYFTYIRSVMVYSRGSGVGGGGGGKHNHAIYVRVHVAPICRHAAILKETTYIYIAVNCGAIPIYRL